MKIGFIGLGQMGAAMASNLVQAGHDVTVWNRSPDKTEPLVAASREAMANAARHAGDAQVYAEVLEDEDGRCGGAGAAVRAQLRTSPSAAVTRPRRIVVRTAPVKVRPW